MLRITKAPRGSCVALGVERAEIEKRLAYEIDVIVSVFGEMIKTLTKCLHNGKNQANAVFIIA